MTSPDTRPAGFPATRLSLVEALASPDLARQAAARDAVARAYWRPVYATLRLTHRFDVTDAEDLTQEFFLDALGKGWLEAWDPTRARFRTWIRTCLRGFAGHARQAERRLKRGGGLRGVPWDAAEVEADLQANQADDDPFDREWARGIIALALEALERRCRAAGHEARWEAFRRYDVEGASRDTRPTYAALAAELDLPVSQVTNHLHWARRAFREEVVGVLREVSPTDADLDEELRLLLGSAP